MQEKQSKPLFSRKRRKNAEDGPREKFYKVKVTEAERIALEARALPQHVTVPRLLVESALAVHPETITERRQLAVELVRVRDLLANIANNTNQLAKVANTDGVIENWATDAALDYRNLRPRLMAVIEGLIDS